MSELLPFLMFGILVAAMLSRPLKRWQFIPLPLALVILGFVSSEIWVAMGHDTGLRWQILQDLVFYILLPIIIFESAINIDIRSLRRESLLIGALSVPLLIIAAFLAALIIHYLLGGQQEMAFPLALLAGSMICATDPTAVSGILRNAGASRRLVQILEGESLINDAATITLFVSLSAILLMPDKAFSVGEVAWLFALILLGSLLTGMAMGWLFDRIIRPFDDTILTTSSTLVLAFMSFWVGEHVLGLSGVVATLSAGLTFAYCQGRHRSEEDVAFALDTWRILSFSADAMLFTLVGMSITVDMFIDHWPAMLVGILAAVVSRAAIIYLGAGPLSLLPGQQKLSMADQNLMLWGGIRGAVAIALALSLDTDMPHWYTIQSMIYGVAMFCLVVQAPLLSFMVSGKKSKAVARSELMPD
ncbi:cation:proton antiporter [Pseudomonadota bacterium]